MVQYPLSSNLFQLASFVLKVELPRITTSDPWRVICFGGFSIDIA